MACYSDIKTAVERDIQKSIDTSLIRGRNTYEFIDGETIKINGKIDNSKSRAWNTNQANQIAKTILKNVQIRYGSKVFAYIDQVSPYDFISVKIKVSPQYIQDIYASLPSHRQSDPSLEKEVWEREGRYGINQFGDSQPAYNKVDYGLRSLEVISSPKGDEIFRKGDKNSWSIEKILNELQIPAAQKELILSFNTRNREEIITNLLANYSYSIEINTAKDNISYRIEDYTEFDPETYEYEKIGYAVYASDSTEPKYIVNTKKEAERLAKQEGRNTQTYSNLTVPGGTNYTENEIATPAITPSIKGHAQFATDNGIGWGRWDEKVQYTEQDIDSLIDILKKSGQLEINCK